MEHICGHSRNICLVVFKWVHGFATHMVCACRKEATVPPPFGRKVVTDYWSLLARFAATGSRGVFFRQFRVVYGFGPPHPGKAWVWGR